ncbi:glutathione S-transferase family protein [Paracoccus sp. S1E-3]|uniref:glutathione S-transferase family protein n=1 Tax=Paracoccus sp. S1E-3 TaxID=2756130 RepID=UPI0015EF3149|nr:glutathione S-transferase family protein [Paracoccus sp. S1E-3]MBA4492354.1 glutathione S-transferase family protein [Paracoccus sp. S1E-3]
MTLTLYTYEWLPEFPRGFVRDIRVRWAAEELGLPYQIATVPVYPKTDAHRDMQPFGQVPMIVDDDLTLFESGAIVLHLAENTDLLPADQRAQIAQWLIAALNSVEPVISAWTLTRLAGRMPQIFGPPSSPEVVEHLRKNMDGRLAALERILAGRNWIAGEFSAADILLADTLRVAAAEDALTDYPALTAYVDRATARPAFQRAMADHMAHWTAADAARATPTNPKEKQDELSR